MEFRPLNPNPVQFLIGHLDSFRIGIGIEFGYDFQSCAGGGAGDQIDDRFVAIPSFGDRPARACPAIPRQTRRAKAAIRYFFAARAPRAAKKG